MIIDLTEAEQIRLWQFVEMELRDKRYLTDEYRTLLEGLLEKLTAPELSSPIATSPGLSMFGNLSVYKGLLSRSESGLILININGVNYTLESIISDYIGKEIEFKLTR